ncbi:Pentatricopeptide repeat-containing protein [Thalictrum thalictroides]|uniref:Pentatricopeptide repeat-containing protein n=1 Tax=Thalictrum thalictroides TaxID=46969 RepID=A0A7J6VJL8_THATH|nr:Pentatricopeptide repeat-containing protein [Thalictrum thalictroides]
MQHQALPFDSYSILFTLKSCSRLQNLTLIQHLHAHLFKIGFSSHVYVATSLLHAYVVSSFEEACKLFDEMPEKNTVTFNTMITGYFKCGDVGKAHSVFDNMPIKNLGSWSAMITGYMGGGNWDKGISLLREMIFDEGLNPDQVAFGSILSRCSNMGYTGLLVGKSIHGFIERNGWNLNVEIGTALVDMYTKCGLLNCGLLIFQSMNERNVLAWSAMICGLAQHGYGEKAIFMFERMKEDGVRPNEITFTGILSACTHVGLVEEGLKYFHRMVEEYGLEPRIQHYGCVVDLLGRAGRLDKAYEVIKTMKLEPNVVVWGSFLAACKLHKQFKMAEKVMEQVLKVREAELTAYGNLVNSLDGLELNYVQEYCKVGNKLWCMGPVSLCNKEGLDEVERGNKASFDDQECLRSGTALLPLIYHIAINFIDADVSTLILASEVPIYISGIAGDLFIESSFLFSYEFYG